MLHQITIPLNLNDNVHASPLEVGSRSLSDVVKISLGISNDVNHARDGARPGILLAGVMVVLLAMAMVVVLLLCHPKSHAPIADNAPEFADALQRISAGVLCLVRQG